MANIYPIQTRSVDPYASYNSNSVNRLTRMITRETNCLHDIYSIDVEADSTAPLTFVVVKEGTAFMSDVYIKIDADFRVDFEDRDFYLDVNPFNEDGYYYVVLDYYYVKSKPAPQASIKILKPSQRAILDTSSRYILLKVVDVIWNGSTFVINPGFFDYDPDYPNHKRIYASLYCGVEDNLPTFDMSRDVSRLIYVRNLQEFYYGNDNGDWEAFSAVRDVVDDVGSCTVGQMAYMDDTGVLQPAISGDSTTFATCVILTTSPKKVRLVGKCDDVQIETGISLSVGDRLFLSATEAGKVTNVIPPGEKIQYLGSCVEVTGLTCSIWFVPNGGLDFRIYDLAARVTALEVDVSSLESRVTALEAKIYRATISSGGDWTLSGGNYYHHIDLPSTFTEQFVIVQCYDMSSNAQIQPLEIACTLTPTTRVTIWMPSNTYSLRVVIYG